MMPDWYENWGKWEHMPDWREREGSWERDEYGLPIRPEGEESDRERFLRESEMREIAHINLQTIALKLVKGLGGGVDGLRRAQQVFEGFAPENPKRERGQRGANDRENDRLLQVYDFCGSSYKSLGDFAIALHEDLPHEHGHHTPEAIEQQLRRLLQRRKCIKR